ncbi:MAG TPA: copper chaperone PCu(A)C [Alphaproteobacteria bacterium]
MNLRFAVVVALLLSPLAAFAQAANDKIVVGDAWARSSSGLTRTAAVYLTLTNRGSEPDRLQSVRTPAAQRAQLHTTVHQGDVMRMQRVDSIEIPPGQTVHMSPGRYHVMLMTLAKPLTQGDKFPLTLRFARAGEVTVEVAVQAPGAMAPGGQMPHRR